MALPDSSALAPPLADDEADVLAFEEPESDLGDAVPDALAEVVPDALADADAAGLAVESFLSPQLAVADGDGDVVAVESAVAPVVAAAELDVEAPGEPGFGVVGGVLSSLAVCVGLELSAGLEVMVGTEVSGVVLGDADGEAAGWHDETGAGFLLTVVEAWLPVPVPEGAPTAT